MRKIPINISVTAADSDKVVGTLCNAAATGLTSDGMVLITVLNHAVRICTSELSGNAL